MRLFLGSENRPSAALLSAVMKEFPANSFGLQEQKTTSFHNFRSLKQLLLLLIMLSLSLYYYDS